MSHLALSAVLLLASSALQKSPAFEGTLELKTTKTSKDGRASAVTHELLYLSPLGQRSEARGDRDSDSKVILRLASLPKVKLMVDVGERTYRKKEVRTRREPAWETFQIDKLGKSTVRGRSCLHVRLIGDRGTTIEEWRTREPNGLEAWSSGAWGDPGSAVAKALQEARIGGFPVKVVIAIPGGSTHTVEVTTIRKGTVPRRLFDLSGYREEKVEEEE
jgi:Domain of unknown function (DUF4412)